MTLRTTTLICLLASAAITCAQTNPAQHAAVGIFQQTCARKAAQAQTMTVSGKDGWLFLNNELRHVGVGKFWGPASGTASRALRPDRRDPLPAIVDYHAQLKQAGIELILVPVPPKAVIYPEKICDQVKPGPDGVPPRLDTHHQAFYALLREHGVRVIDLASEFIALRTDNQGETYCRTDTHWSGRGCALAARVLADDLKKRDWYADVPKTKLSAEEKQVSVTGDLLEYAGGDRPGPETVSLRFVGHETATGLEPVEPDRSSPVLVLADSHGLVFHAGDRMHARGAGLTDQLTLELGFPVDLIAARGSAADAVRRKMNRVQKQNPSYLAAKKVVIWCFSAREFTEASGWSKIPVTGGTS